MSESAVLWVVGTLVSLVLALGAMLLSHFKDCRDFRVKMSADMATLQADVKRVINDIGDHDSGMRGDIHDLRATVSPFVAWAERQQERDR